MAILLIILLIAVPAFAASPGDPVKGKELYGEMCSLCHGPKGKGWDWGEKVVRPPVTVPDLTDRVSMAQRSDEELFEIIKKGGEGVGRTRFMPPFGFQLTDEEIWDLVAFLRNLAQPSGRSK